MSTKTTTVLSCDVCRNEITEANKARRPLIENINAHDDFSPYFVYTDICRHCNEVLISVIDKAVKDIRSAK